MQAIFSVAAIVASSVIAILVPLHVRNRDARDSVQRSIANTVILVGITRSLWEGLFGVLKSNEFSEHTRDIFQPQVASARSVAAQVPHSVMMGEAFEVVAGCSMVIEVFVQTINRLCDANEIDAVSRRIPFADVFGDLDRYEEMTKDLQPQKVDGMWMIATDEEVAEAIRQTERSH